MEVGGGEEARGSEGDEGQLPLVAPEELRQPAEGPLGGRLRLEGEHGARRPF